MATLPSESHRARQIAESFGSDPERYDRTRPRYPRELVDRILAGSPGRDVLDVGIGTGVAARPFLAAGCRVLGVEVDPRMAEFARCTGLTVEVAKFEDWDAAGRSFDIVVAGQTWHWVDPVAGAGKAAEVLRPGGRIALFWNAFQSSAMWDAFGEVYRRVVPDFPFLGGPVAGAAAYAGQLTRTADGLARAGGFGEVEDWRFDWEREYTRAEWLDQVPTFGGHSQVRPEQLAELSAALGAVIDEVGGRFRMGYSAVAVSACRTAG
jgi:SAM-dependent methyltransferase